MCASFTLAYLLPLLAWGMEMAKTCILAALAVAGLVLASTGAQATTYNVPAAQQGWIFQDGFHNTAAPAQNYGAGNCGECWPAYDGEFRNYFSFNIPALDSPLVSATLNILAASVILAQAPHSITYQLTSTPAAPAFAQLGTGTIFGSRVFGLADNLTTVSINLNGALLAAIGTGGGNLLISGRVTEGASFEPAAPSQQVFGNSQGNIPTLVLETAPIGDVPVPAALPLFASGLATIAFYAHRRRRPVAASA